MDEFQNSVRLLAWSIALVVVNASVAVAAPACGDPLKQGHVSLSDGVQIQRAAVELSSECTPEICDVDLNGRVSVTDAVLALRVAAEIEGAHVSCSRSEVDDQVGRTGPFHDLGKLPQGSSATQTAGAQNDPCPNGGHIDTSGSAYDYVDCDDGNTVTTGRIEFTDDPDALIVTFQNFRVRYLQTGEERTLEGRLSFVYTDDSLTELEVSGPIHTTSSRLGEFTDNLTNVIFADLDAADGGHVVAGEFRTDVAAGQGPYAHLTQLTTTLYRSGLRVARVTFQGGAVASFVDAGESRLCETCNPNSSCGEALSCRPCTDCGGSTQRCAIGDPVVACGDGHY